MKKICHLETKREGERKTILNKEVSYLKAGQRQRPCPNDLIDVSMTSDNCRKRKRKNFFLS
jgi:hypothetical protein